MCVENMRLGHADFIIWMWVCLSKALEASSVLNRLRGVLLAVDRLL